jgi:hypothetical protein
MQRSAVEVVESGRHEIVVCYIIIMEWSEAEIAKQHTLVVQ